ncbi:unnamed protein product [Urochloa decumbens]|uniref:Uncharacterized protein n=1 Tax=Urochloa decumbens TaxID=240449 RepID=A0ABC9GVF6_9POAL
MFDGDEADLVASPAVEWRSHSIFRVPPHFKMVHGSAFKPQAVTLGPFHHDRDGNAIMEGHKRRAVRHLLRRAGKTLADELEDAYAGLDSEWLGQNRGRFLEVMIADGCFLLEVMRNYAIEMNKKDSNDYMPSDPVFSPHAVVHIAAFLQRDMLMIESQLPLRLLQRIVAVEGRPSEEASINKEVLRFLGINHEGAADGQLGLHPVDIYGRGLLGSAGDAEGPAGRLHVMACKDVTAFVLFLKDMVDSADDVARLWKAGVLRQDIAGSDGTAVALLQGLTRDVAKTVRDAVELHCRASWRVLVFESWAKLRNTYFTSVWGTVALTSSSPMLCRPRTPS